MSLVNRHAISVIYPVSYTHLDVYKRQVVYRRAEKEMPAGAEEIEEAREEGVEIITMARCV